MIEAVGGKLPDAFAKFRDAAKEASQQAGTGIKSGVGAAVRDVQTGLSTTDWAGWADNAVDATGRAYDAVNRVAVGASPGGIKDIPIQLARATRATHAFAHGFIQQMDLARRTADALGDASMIEMQGNVRAMPRLQHDVIHNVAQDTTRQDAQSTRTAAMLETMLKEIQTVAEMPTNVFEAGAVSTTLQAWGIADRKDIERTIAKAALDRIVANDGGLMADFEKVVRRVAR